MSCVICDSCSAFRTSIYSSYSKISKSLSREENHKSYIRLLNGMRRSRRAACSKLVSPQGVKVVTYYMIDEDGYEDRNYCSKHLFFRVIANFEIMETAIREKNYELLEWMEEHRVYPLCVPVIHNGYLNYRYIVDICGDDTDVMEFLLRRPGLGKVSPDYAKNMEYSCLLGKFKRELSWFMPWYTYAVRSKLPAQMKLLKDFRVHPGSRIPGRDIMSLQLSGGVPTLDTVNCCNVHMYYRPSARMCALTRSLLPHHTREAIDCFAMCMFSVPFLRAELVTTANVNGLKCYLPLEITRDIIQYILDCEVPDPRVIHSIKG